MYIPYPAEPTAYSNKTIYQDVCCTIYYKKVLGGITTYENFMNEFIYVNNYLSYRFTAQDLAINIYYEQGRIRNNSSSNENE